MKKLFILSALCLGLAGTRALAQDFTFDAGTVAVTTAGLDLSDPNVSLDDAVTVYNHVNNESSGDLTGMQWQIIQTFDSTVAARKGWFIHTFCDNIICYPSVQLSSSTSWPLTFNVFQFATILYRGHSDFKMQVVVPKTTPNGTVGIAKVRAWSANQSDTATYMVTKIAGNGISVVKMNDNRVTVYPNPALQNEVTIFVNKELKATQAKIYNMLGAEVASATIEGELARVNTAALASGTYLVQVQDASGALIATRKLIKE